MVLMGKRDYTLYERTRIISARALQISQGAHPMVKVPKEMKNPIEIARLEWEKGLIPIDIKRKTNNNS